MCDNTFTTPDPLVEEIRSWDPYRLIAKDLFEAGDSEEIKEEPFKNFKGDFLQPLRHSIGESRALFLIDILGKS